MNIPFNITDKGVTVFIDGCPRSFASNHSAYTDIVRAIHDGNENAIRELADVRATVNTRSQGRVTIGENAIHIDGREIHGRLIDRILEMVRLGSEAVDSYVRFLDNLYNNPSARAVNELWGFIEACDLPITGDGHFLAYRFVNRDYLDTASRSVCNKPASIMDESELSQYREGVIGGQRKEVTTQVIDGVTTIFCDRNMVDEDKDRTCSHGLHFCSYGYLPSYGMGVSDRRRVIVVKINPADVVAIPSDHNNEKGRTCHYTILSEIEDWSEPVLTPYYTDEYDVEDDMNDVLDSLEVPEEYLDNPDIIDDAYDDEDLVDETMFDEMDVLTPGPVPTPVQTPGTPTLNAAQVANIRALWNANSNYNLSMTAIAGAYGVHRETVARILRGETWRHVAPAAIPTWPVKFQRGS